MNKQEIFDKVVTHLLTQNEKSLGEDGRCKYRGQNGLMCAVGCLIADNDYHSAIEGCSADSSVVRAVLGYGPLILTYLQIIHDKTEVSGWPYTLYRLAIRESLIAPQILLDRLEGTQNA